MLAPAMIHDNVNYPSGKSIFAVNLPLKLFPATVANADIGSLSIHYLISIWTTCWWNLNIIVWSKLHEFLTFWWKKSFLKPVLTKRWRHFGRRFCDWNNCLLLNYFQTTIFQCSKNYGSPTRVTSVNLHRTWQTRLVLKTQDSTLNSYTFVVFILIWPNHFL